MTHSLKYFYTASSGIPNFPEFVTVGLVDDVAISHYDSFTNKDTPKQDWMSKFTEDDPQYWQRNTETYVGTQQTFKGNIEIVKQRLNQTGGEFMFHCLKCDFGVDVSYHHHIQTHVQLSFCSVWTETQS